jgi:hypothetical protein
MFQLEPSPSCLKSNGQELLWPALILIYMLFQFYFQFYLYIYLCNIFVYNIFSPTCQSTIRLRPKIIHKDRIVATTPKVNFGQVIFQLPPTIRRIARRIQSLSKKIINAESAISFNKNCLWEDILPNNTNIYISAD